MNEAFHPAGGLPARFLRGMSVDALLKIEVILQRLKTIAIFDMIYLTIEQALPINL